MRGMSILLAAAFAVGIVFGGLRLDLQRPGAPVPMPRPEAATMPDRVDYREVGQASWYGPGFHGRETASGEVFEDPLANVSHHGKLLAVEQLHDGGTSGHVLPFARNDARHAIELRRQQLLTRFSGQPAVFRRQTFRQPAGLCFGESRQALGFGRQ